MEGFCLCSDVISSDLRVYELVLKFDLSIATMFSIDSKAYSSELRWRMVHQRCMLGLSYREISGNLNVDPSTACVQNCKTF